MRYVTNCTRDFAEMLPHVAASVFRCTGTDLHCYDLDGDLATPPHVVRHDASDLKEWLAVATFGTRRGGRQKWPAWMPRVCQRALADADGESVCFIGSDSLMLEDITPFLADSDIATTIHPPSEFDANDPKFKVVNLNILTYSPFATQFVREWSDLTGETFIDQESFVRLLQKHVNFKHVATMVNRHRRYTQIVNGMRVLFLPMYEFNRTTGLIDQPVGDPQGAYLLHFRAMLVKPAMRQRFFEWAHALESKEAVCG